MKEYYSIRDIIKIDTKQNLRKAMRKWGIEKTEEKIKQHYGDNAKAYSFMMECYKEIIKGD